MRFFLGIGFGMLVCLLMLEGLLRFLPVSSGARMESTSIEKPFSRYLPNQHYVYSYGWALANAKHGVTNSSGFINSSDLSEQGDVLVVGDSFIESFMLDFPETLQGRLEQYFPGKVQAISASGNGLADSLQIVKYFTPNIRPSVVVLFVEATDISTLLEPAGKGHNSFVVNKGANISMIHNPYTESPNKIMLLRSSLARYLYYNLKFPDWTMKATKSTRRKTPVNNADNLSTKELVLNFYFSQLCLLGAENGFRVVFLLDGDRKAIYSGNVEQIQAHDDHSLFLKLALKNGLDVVDMQPVFKRHWDQKHERMDFLPSDGHWNPVAHKLAADEIMNLLNK